MENIKEYQLPKRRYHTEQIAINDQIIAIIIYSEFNKDGVEFFTPGDFSQQLGYMRHEKGDTI
jgi:hypothetical protein